jgi:hypothetical protein
MRRNASRSDVVIQEELVRVRAQLLSVDFAAVARMQHQDKKTVVVDLIENAIVTDANPISIDASRELDRAVWAWFYLQFRHGQQDTFSNGFG